MVEFLFQVCPFKVARSNSCRVNLEAIPFLWNHAPVLHSLAIPFVFLETWQVVLSYWNAISLIPSPVTTVMKGMSSLVRILIYTAVLTQCVNDSIRSPCSRFDLSLLDRIKSKFIRSRSNRIESSRSLEIIDRIDRNQDKLIWSWI